MKEFICNNGRKLVRLSRWITIQHNYNPSPKNRLAYYITDGNGYSNGQANFDKSTGLYLDFFRWNGRNYAINQFLILGGPWTGGQPYMFTDTDGCTTVVSAYDGENYYNPIMIELDDCAEHVRVYQEV